MINVTAAVKKSSNIGSLADLKANKAATGRNKDKADLDYLP